MFRKIPLYLFTGLIVSHSSLCYSNECSFDEDSDVTGTIKTLIKSPNDPRLASLGIVNFAFSYDENTTISCGIEGAVVRLKSPSTGLPELNHFAYCNNGSSFSSVDRIVYYAQENPADPCVVSITENSQIIFKDPDGNLIEGTTETIGTLNSCTGQTNLCFQGNFD